MERAKGTVTPLASVFSAEESQKAAKRLEETIGDRQRELNWLRGFAADNTGLVNLVQRLPDELSHEIMVPFGSAAFFPGRLIHTNEFLVLLGEGYYAERSSKQTVEILQRRGKSLESQVESLKATIADLEVEAKFLDVTAYEAAEGVVDIREEYVEEDHQGTSSNSGKPYQFKSENMNVAIDDEDYARIMARMDELEKEELAAQSGSSDEEDVGVDANFGCSISKNFFDDNDYVRSYVLKIRSSMNVDSTENQIKDLTQKLEDAKTTYSTAEQPSGIASQRVPSSRLSIGDIKEQPGVKESSLHEMERIDSRKQPPGPSEPKKVQAVAPVSEAFTGTVVERSTSSLMNQSSASSQVSSSNPSKPVSRFKMQRANRG
ncbi:hypothetical protein QJS04_geneDACA021802 [Acorus gramineus]|uniref:RNA polymerase II subunit 5-mediating protein homolog n=1 Tax=Acorus gramineus TaxID=55184 RepID=A0AAV9A6Y5_ACOGR|nr:hypothetical protein QJS04_geneDACA021802 [Acorus gramineus]